MKVSFSATSLYLLASGCISPLSNIVDAADMVAPIAEASDRCTNIQTPALGCFNNEDPEIFTVTYPDVHLQCKFALTLEQSGKEPTVSLVDDSAGIGDDDFYTIILVDTADTVVHPILHYGASNVKGSDLIGELVLADSNPFSGYRGPSPPAGMPGTESLLANYEWIVAKQEAFVEASDLPVVASNISFGYTEYLEDVKGEVLSTMYFSSGYCVDEIVNDGTGGGNGDGTGNGDGSGNGSGSGNGNGDEGGSGDGTGSGDDSSSATAVAISGGIILSVMVSLATMMN